MRRVPRIRLWTRAPAREAAAVQVARHAAVGAALGVTLLVLRCWQEYLWIMDRMRYVGVVIHWRDNILFGLGAMLAYAVPSACSALRLRRFVGRLGRERIARTRQIFPRLFPRALAGPRRPVLSAIWIAGMVTVLGCLEFHLLIDREFRWMAEEAVVLPYASYGKESPPRHPCVTVNITKSKGEDEFVRCVISKKVFTPGGLDQFLDFRARRNPRPDGRTRLAVNIRADSYVEFGYVQRVLAACRRAGVRRVSFGVAPDPSRRSGRG